MTITLSPLPECPHAEVDAWLLGLPDAVGAPLQAVAGTLGPLLATAPYLFELARRHADWLAGALGGQAETAQAAVLAAVGEAGRSASDEATLARALRQAKGRVALLAAIAETGGAWSTAQSTAALSDLADAALEATVALLMRLAHARGRLARSVAAGDSGLALFALGKHGGRELNYSSDIDIVAFYDTPAGLLTEPDEATKFYTGVVRRIVALMEERQGNDYVFRTDLRLRPDPGSTPLALPVGAALAYYESRGQNWERAAWIKARPCAGDKAVGNAFLADLTPYVWRRHLDFATIADIQAMKRQINIAKSVGEARVEGHNVKLGRGGIREIEFFTQTQQLIAGGRDRSLRVRPTAVALNALADAGWITPAAAADLVADYWFLRAVENRLQMRRDEQTHIMPETEEGIAAVARLMGEPDVVAFEARYRSTLDRVIGHYAALFTEGDTLGTAEGSLVFTGSDDDPATLETLSRMGFADPARVSATVRKWHYGSYAATRAAAARAHLTELLPALLRAVAASGSPDETMARLDDFLARLPAGVQLFALLRTHERLLALLIELLASAPRLTEAVIHRAHVMDALIDPAFADDVWRQEVLVAKVDAFLADATDFQQVIDHARIIGQEQKFLIATGLVAGTLSAERAAEQFTALAETLLRRLFTAVRAEFEKRHGVVPGAPVALLAFGKMASREMTFTSDIDFILLYDAAVSEMSDGERPLAGSHYFTRLTQRLVAALSAPTGEGVLYEADMRLRPSGNAGPLATSLLGFIDYHRDSAWTWEHLALSRARVVAADPGMAERVYGAVAAIMARPRDPQKTVSEVLAMRALMAKERRPRHVFDFKLAAGALIDLEFIAQTGQLLVGTRLGVPQAPTTTVLARLGAVGLLPESERLVSIHGHYSTVVEAMSAALLHPFDDREWTKPFEDLLARLTGYPSFTSLAEDVAVMEREVMSASTAFYARLVNERE